MDIVEEARGFEIDHEPDGWPAIRMRQVSALCDEITALRAEVERMKAELEAATKWQPIETLTQIDGDVLIYDPDWIDEDFNPSGIREGFRNESDTGPIWTASWNGEQDFWMTLEDQQGAYWMPKPTRPTTEGEEAHKREPFDFAAVECWCQSCDMEANNGLASRMSVCPECGSKRCQRARHHDNVCTEGEEG